MVPDSLDLPMALELLGLETIPDGFDELARRVVRTHPAADALSDVQSVAYRVVWQELERRMLERTGAGH
jgi:hypothetical protein